MVNGDITVGDKSATGGRKAAGKSRERPVPQRDGTCHAMSQQRSAIGNEAARAFLAFLTGPEAAQVIAKFGYAPE